jgi:hypothetical protein
MHQAGRALEASRARSGNIQKQFEQIDKALRNLEPLLRLVPADEVDACRLARATYFSFVDRLTVWTTDLTGLPPPMTGIRDEEQGCVGSLDLRPSSPAVPDSPHTPPPAARPRSPDRTRQDLESESPPPSPLSPEFSPGTETPEEYKLSNEAFYDHCR